MPHDYELRAGQAGWYLVYGDESIGPLETKQQAESYLHLLDAVSRARYEIVWTEEDDLALS